MTSSSSYRLDPAGDSGGPILQVIAATLPVLGILIYFLVLASRRPSSACENIPADADDEYLNELYGGECAKEIPLSDMIYTYLAFGQVWAILAVYLSAFVPLRQRLVLSYLSSKDGNTTSIKTIGDVFYNDRSKTICQGHEHYGHITYPHPNFKQFPVYIRKKVRVFERYTRERVPILLLNDKPFSGQPKSDLEVDVAVSKRNCKRMRFLTVYSWIWVAFCLSAPIYIMVELSEVYDDDLEYGGDTWTLYTIVAGLMIPAVSFAVNWIAWKRLQYWVTHEAKVYEEGERRDGGGYDYCCCGALDDPDQQDYEYEPPTPPTSVDQQQQQQPEEEGTWSLLSSSTTTPTTVVVDDDHRKKTDDTVSATQKKKQQQQTSGSDQHQRQQEKDVVSSVPRKDGGSSAAGENTAAVTET